VISWRFSGLSISSMARIIGAGGSAKIQTAGRFVVGWAGAWARTRVARATAIMAKVAVRILFLLQLVRSKHQ
jgi:hypothetical protein